MIREEFQITGEFLAIKFANELDFDKLPANAKTDLANEENVADYFEVNVVGTINVLGYCRKNGIKNHCKLEL